MTKWNVRTVAGEDLATFKHEEDAIDWAQHASARSRMVSHVVVKVTEWREHRATFYNGEDIS